MLSYPSCHLNACVKQGPVPILSACNVATPTRLDEDCELPWRRRHVSGSLTPSRPQPVQNFRAERCTDAPANSIFSGPIT